MAKTLRNTPAVFRQPITDATRIIGVEPGKMPPQALDMEEYVLGAIMLERDAIFEIMSFLKPECFYKEAHAKIYQATLNLSAREEPIDANTVAHELRTKEQLEEVGGMYFLATLTNKVMSAANIEFNARIVHQKYLQRELIRISSEIQRKSFDESTDVDELLNTAEQSIFELAQGNLQKETQPISAILPAALEKIQRLSQGNALLGSPSGFTDIDRVTAGWQPTDLVIIAARPAMGKTAFVLSMARNMAVDHKCPVAVFSLEMSAEQLTFRLMSGETEIEMERIRSGKNLAKEDWDRILQKINVLSQSPLFIDETPALSVFEFRAKCRRLVQQHQIKVAFIDYLQLMEWTGDKVGNREQAVSNISRSLKAIAKELEITIIALAQLSRKVEQRKDMKPQLTDLRESGAIEQDADIVAFIHRPDYYGIDEDESGNSTKGMAEIIIAKHRNGATDTIPLRFRPEYVKFTDLEASAIDYLGQPQQTFQSKMNADIDSFSTPTDNAFSAPTAFPSPSASRNEDAPF